METILALGLKYWKQIIVVMFLISMVGSVVYLYKDNESLSGRLALAQVDKKVAIDDYNRLSKAQTAQNKQIEDLQSRNADLEKALMTSQTTINTMAANASVLVGKIKNQVLPLDCQGKINWLKQQALQIQKDFPEEEAPLPQPPVKSSLLNLVPSYLKGGH
jgi:hypothetical protein